MLEFDHVARVQKNGAAILAMLGRNYLSKYHIRLLSDSDGNSLAGIAQFLKFDRDRSQNEEGKRCEQGHKQSREKNLMKAPLLDCRIRHHNGDNASPIPAHGVEPALFQAFFSF